MSAHGLWAITCFFNPVGYRRRRENFRLFRARLVAQGVPLVAVELSFGQQFELGSGDAEILLQFNDGDVMWQKERLLNIALATLPRDCTKVAWLDGDILFPNPDWPLEASRRLDTHPLIQLFGEAHFLLEPTDGLKPVGAMPHWTVRSALQSMSEGVVPAEFMIVSEPSPASSTGYAWAARREIMETHLFYDGCIVGGGDNALACAACGKIENLLKRRGMTSGQREDYLAWALPFQDAVLGRTAWLDGAVWHLWHGAIEGRRYHCRHSTLIENDFDPRTDIALGRQGCWKWATEKPLLHQAVRDHFFLRDEGY